MAVLPHFSLRFQRACLALALAWPALASAGLRVETGPSTLVYPDFWHTPLGIHKGTPRLLNLLLGEGARFDDPAGLACGFMRQGEDLSPQITAFGLNRGRNQIVYNPTMTSLSVFGAPGSGRGQFLHPSGIACHSNGRVIVADTGNHRLALLQYEDGELHWQGSLGSPGQGPGQFFFPEGVALDSQGRIYVADTGNHRVQILSPEGRPILSFGGDPEANNSLEGPSALAVVDPMEPDSSLVLGGIFVVDRDHSRLQRFDLAGNFMGQATARELGRVNVRFEGIGLDYFNNVWVADKANHRIHKLDRFLRWVDSWGGPGSEDGQLNEPRGLAVHRHFGQVLVLEKQAAQYFWIGVDVKDLALSARAQADGTPAKVGIDYRLTERAWVDLWVEDESGKKVAQLLKRRLQAQGAQALNWDGTVDHGQRRADPGVYSLAFRVEATYSSATFVVKEMKRRFALR